MAEALQSGRVTAFYGYKGGAGRSSLAVNIAATLSAITREQLGRVLLIDWDLEAPGIGDFLDFDPSIQMPEKWRRSPGVFDLLKECAVAVRTKDDPQPLNALIAKYFREHTLSVAFPGFADYPISFLGPGCQDPANYKEDLMAADWVRFFEVNAEDFRRAFREEVEAQKFSVIIDTRTGANLASLFVLDALAEQVYLVSPRTYQALEGTYWMVQMLRTMDTRLSNSKSCKLILSRHTTLSTSTQDADDISTVIRKFFGTSAPDFQFPHLDCLSNQEKLVFSDADLAAVLFPTPAALETETPAESSYRLNFWNLCKEIGGISVEASRLKEIETRILSARQTAKLTPRSYAQFVEGKRLADQLLLAKRLADQLLLADIGPEKPEPDRPADRLGSPGEIDRPKQTGEQQLIDLLNWIAHANVFARTALGLELKSQANVDLLPWLKDKLKDKLQFEWPFEPSGTAAGASPTFDQLPVAPHHAKPTMPSGQSELSKTAQLRAYELYSQGLKEYVDNDDPAKAEALMAQAVDAAQISLDGAGIDQRERLDNSRVIYAWCQARAMLMIHPAADVIAFIEQAIHFDQLPEARGADSNTIVKADYCSLYLSVCCEYLDERRGADAEVDADILARVEEIRSLGEPFIVPREAARIGLSPQEARYTRYLMSSVDVKRASVPGVTRTDAEKLLRQQAENSHLLSIASEKDGKSYSALGELRLALKDRAQLCVLSIQEKDLQGYQATLSRIRSAVDECLTDGAGSPEKVTEIISFISFLDDCGCSREAYDRCWDVSQMIGRKTDETDVRSELNRMRLRGLAAAVESHLGRPDRAIVIAKELRQSWLKGNVAGSKRAQYLADFEWWPFATQYETGHPNEAWTELRAIETEYKRAAEEAVTETDRSIAKRQLNSLSPWLAHIAGSLGEHSQVEKYARLCLARYDRNRLEGVTVGRSTAYCELVWAESVYVQGKHECALELLQNALAHNEAGAKSFQGSFLRLQCQISIMSAEIRAFGAGCLPMVTCDEIDSSVKELAVWGADILMDHTGEFYFTNRVLAGTSLAIAAAVIAKIGDSSDRALHLANHVLGDWLSFGQGVEQEPENAWVTELANLPRALASAVAAKCTRFETRRDHAQQATAFVKSLASSKKDRYRRIFEFCEIQLSDGPAPANE